MNPSDVRSGVAVGGPKWPEPVYIHNVERVGSYVRMMGRTASSQMAVDDILTQEDIRHMKPVDEHADAAGDPRRAFLAVEAMRLARASADDPLFTLHASAVDPLPHQIEAAYSYALWWPRVRFMLAHDAGTGKTVTAGLILKEMVMRQDIRGALVVAPARLHEHWRRELDRLNITAHIADRSPGEHTRSAWDGPYTVIASADFLERADVMPYLESAPPDIIIVEEAHALLSRPAPEGGRPLAESLQTLSEHLLLLTATPPPESSVQFRRLLDMLEPGFLADPHMTQESMDAADNPLFLRRTAKTLKDFEGDMLYGTRRVETIPVAPSDIEGMLYGAVSDYIGGRYRRAGPDPAPPQLLEIPYMMASGVYALLQGLERRRRGLADALHDYQEGAIPADGREDAEAEIKSLDRLATMARRVLDSDTEQKIKTLHNILKDAQGTKVLVMVGSADTLQYVDKKIRSWGHAVCTIHDDMQHADRVQAETLFKNKIDIMVATEAVGEGMDVQFCSRLINYDIPWDPERLARRLGYLRRYENRSDITIQNMLLEATPEGMVMRRFLDHLNAIRDDMGDDHIFDVAGGIMPGDTFSGMMTDAATGVRDPDHISTDMNTRVAEWHNTEGRHTLDESLVARSVDLQALSRMAEDSRPHMATPEYTRDIFARTLDMLGGRVRRRPDGLDAIDYIPPELRQVADASGHTIHDRYPKVAFGTSHDMDAEAVAPGHPMFETAVGWIIQNCTEDARRGALFTDPDGVMNGYLLFHELDIRDQTGAVAGRRIVSHFVDQGTGATTYKHPTILWDLQPGGEPASEVHRRTAEARAAESVFGMAERYRDEILMERRRQAGVRERYGLASLDGIIRDIDQSMRAPGSADPRIALQRRAWYVRCRQRLAGRISQEQELSIRAPRLVAWARVVSGSSQPPDPKPRMAGMAASMAYERRCDRLPVNVSGRSMGYDIISRDAQGRARYIAVRARERRGGVSITPNELRVARNTRADYYLYVMYGGEQDPVRVPDPGRTIPANRDDIRHAVSEDYILAHAEP